ncbi:MAG: redox-sensing transcriptional repressor Rex [Bacteroidota bacterium]
MPRINANRKNTERRIPEPTLKRLPAYLHYLQKKRELGEITITAPAIASELKADPTQVVKDLSFTGVKGRPRIGYNLYEVIRSIEEFYGFNQTSEAFLIGAGNLGSALLTYPNLQGFGLKIIAAFDVDKAKIGNHVGPVTILHLDKFKGLAERLKVEIAILTTPGSVAQEIAELMIESGIKAIWNLTPVNLNVPEDTIVQNTSMYANVAVLLQKLKASRKLNQTTLK